MPPQPKFSLLAAISPVGWGGAGTLRLILEKLPGASVAFHGDEHAIAVTKEFLGSQHKFDAPVPPRFDVALVINDPAGANSIADLNIPIVYLDSLPYLRKTDDDVPELTRVAHYCAQKYPIDLLPLTRACPQLEDSQAHYRVIHRRSADSELTDAPLRPSGRSMGQD
jgi:hypothetical protein